jgi:hypothetical protein
MLVQKMDEEDGVTLSDNKKLWLKFRNWLRCRIKRLIRWKKDLKIKRVLEIWLY